MTAADKIRALMMDGRRRTPAEVIRETGLAEWPVRGALRRLCFDYCNPVLLRVKSPPSTPVPSWARRHPQGRGALYLLNPNCRDALALTA